MPSNKIVTVDFETIPDIALAEYLTNYKGPEAPDLAEIKDDFANRVQALDSYARTKYHTKEGEGDPPMLPPGLNRIVTAGVHIVEAHQDATIGEWYETQHLSSTAEDEKTIVTNMVGWLTKLRPRVVSYNGRSFDMPLLIARSLHHRLSMGFWFTDGDKWNNYTSRYCPDWHFDVMDFLTQWGASSRMKLREVMALVRLPDKTYGGGDVLDFYANGDMGRCREYCELDCLNTFLTFVWCQFLRGAISEVGRDASLRSVIGFLKKNLVQEYLRNFLYEWCSLDQWVAGECTELFTTVVPPSAQ